MKHFSKLIALILVLVIAFSAASCSLVKQSSYKTKDVDLPIGVYIYYAYASYQQAQQFAQKSDKYDSEKETYDGKKSFLQMEITDDDGKKATADEWIKAKTTEYMDQLVALYSEIKRLGSTIDEATIKSNKEQCDNDWELGQYYSMYAQQYGEETAKQYCVPLKDTLEPLGISKESYYIANYYYSMLNEQIFKDLYGATGEQAVKDSELEKFFKDNYITYKYFSKNLYDTEEQPATDGSSETQSVNKAFSEDKKKSVIDDFKGYVADINDGESFNSIKERYMDDYDVKDDPVTSDCKFIDDMDKEDNISAAVLKLKETKASTDTIGESDDSKQQYLFYRAKIESEVKLGYLKDETKRDEVLHNCKKDDFKEHLAKTASVLDIQRSGACNQYSPAKIESMVNAQKKDSKK